MQAIFNRIVSHKYIQAVMFLYMLFWVVFNSHYADQHTQK